MYLLPDRILVYAPNGVGAVEYNVLNLSSKPTRFIEEDTVPPDATVVDHTWRYVNKNGDPDRRFNNNRQIPICQYEELKITSPTGVREILHLSRLGVSTHLESAISALVDCIHSAQAAEEARNGVEEQIRPQAPKESSTPAPKETVRDAGEKSRPERLHAALFDILGCIMVADGRASAREKSAIREIMSKVNSGWTDDECDGHISSFIGDIQNQGYATVLRRAMAQLPMFKQIGRQGVLIKCIDLVANADNKLSKRERDLCGRIRRSIRVVTANDTTQNDAPERRNRAF